LGVCHPGLNQRSKPDAQTIRAQFHTLSLRFHPDKNQGSGEAKATARFQDILKAYEHLIHQNVTCEEVIEEKAKADRSETQPAKMTKKDRENGHFRQGDENQKKLGGRQARAMHRKSKQPKIRATKVHLQLKRREREERQQRATETKKYEPESRNKTTRIKKTILENPDDPVVMDVDVDVYRNLNAISRQMRGAKPLRPELELDPLPDRPGWSKVEEKVKETDLNLLFIVETEEVEEAVVAADFEAIEKDMGLVIPREFIDPLTWDPMLKAMLKGPETQGEIEEYAKQKALREGLETWRKSCAIPEKLKTLAGEGSADKEDLRVQEYVKRYILEELVEDNADDEILDRELDCIEWREDVDSWELDNPLPLGFQLEHILPTGFTLAHLPSGFEVDVALPIGFKALDALARRDMIMVDDDMVGAHRGKREISEISDVIGVNMEKRIRKTFARRKEKERKAARKDVGRFL
jgi:hypothetical protein